MRALVLSVVLAGSAIVAPGAFAKTYEEAAASGVSPVTASEMFQCAVYWDTWAQSLNPDYFGEGKGIWDGDWLATLNPAVRLPAARETADYWFKQAKAEFKANGEAAKHDELLQKAPKYNLTALSERKFLQWLGECALPAN